MTEQFLKAAQRKKKREAVKVEKDAEERFVNLAKKFGCRAYKLVLLGLRGFPDRTVLCPGGRVFFIEFKRKNRKFKEESIQGKYQKILTKLGFQYYVCYTFEEAENCLKEFLESS